MSRLGRLGAGLGRMARRATGYRAAAQREQQRLEREAGERGMSEAAQVGSARDLGAAPAGLAKSGPADEPSADTAGAADPRQPEGEALAARARQAVVGGAHPPSVGAGAPPPPAAAPPATADGKPPPDAMIPWGVRVAAEAGWRMLVLAAVIWVLIQVVGAISLLVISFTAGLLITALLQPFVGWLKRIGFGRGAATVVTAFGGFAVMGLMGWFVVWQVIDNSQDLSDRFQDGVERLRDWLLDLPFHITEENLNEWVDSVNEWINENQDTLTSAGLEATNYLVEFFSGAALTLFVVLFLLYDGQGVWRWFLKLVPANARPGVAGAGPRAWMTLTGYVRGTVIVALIDAVGIGLGLVILGVPMAVPLAVIVFVASFVPLVGAIVSGALAVMVTVVTNGVVDALIVLGVVLLVQQIEGHILQPFILGRMVRVHPLAVVLGVAAGSMLAGIPGAIVAVPLIAVTNTVVGYLRAYHEEAGWRAAGMPATTGATIAELAPTQPPPTAPDTQRTAEGPTPGSGGEGSPADENGPGRKPD
ncbi:AI-2E family transporter [Streptomyces sp. B6B3]|uniref:AI-2E family transporter n=1 Tax=Streptomyces sp. B6B3 TaxID=3153570 RepID=UPI00325E0B2A